MTRPRKMLRLACAWLAVALLVPAARAHAAADTAAEAAPDAAWTMSRGSLAGTGRSESTIALPLAERWHRRFEKTAFGATPVIDADTIYLGDLDGTFHALALDSGTSRWSFKAEAAGFPSSAAVSPDPAVPLVVVGDDTGVVRAFDRATGKVVWEYETDGEISGGPTVLPGADGRPPRVLVGSQDASLSCLALADGKPFWKHSIADQIRCSPTVARGPQGDRVFLAGCDGKLHVLDAATGAAITAVPIDGPTGTTPAASGDRVFFGTEGGAFFAIDFLKGEVAWRMQPAVNPQSYRSSAAVSGDLVIVGSRGRAVEAFAAADGARRWRRPMRGKVDASAVVARRADGGDVVIAADAAGKIVALAAGDGAPLWEFDAGGGFSAGPAVAAGKVVLASDDGTVWCFGTTGR